MKIKSTIKTPIHCALLAGVLVAGMNVAAAFAADAPAPTAHSDGMMATLDDTAITAKVKSKLMGEKRLNHSDISVTTTNGVVTLTGHVATAHAKALAETHAKAVEGVKSVDNSLVTASSSKTEADTKKAMAKTGHAMSDSWITTKVKSEILADSVSKGFDVNVTTTHGVVVLTGKLANKDAIEHVKDIAAKVEDVKSVDTTGLVVGK